MVDIIIPVYKPDGKLIVLVDQLWVYGCRMLVVDDGSGEEYEAVFDKICDICIVLHHAENQGKGAAIKTALSYIETEMWDCNTIGIMDADGQQFVEDMFKILSHARTNKHTLILGVRKIGRHMPLKSRLRNKITRSIIKVVSGASISDTQTGLRAFDVSLLEVLLSVKGERYEYETNMLLQLAKEEITIKEVEISTVYYDKTDS